MKKCITQFLILSLMIQSLGQVLFFADAHALTFNPFVAEISAEDLDYTSDIGDIFMDGEDESGANLTADELGFIQLARLMERQHIHCTAAGEGKGYKLGIIFDPDDPESPKTKTIDCNEVAKFMFNMNKSSLENSDRAFACFTQDWDYDTKLDFFNNLEDVAISAEKHFNCPGKDMNAGKSSGTDNADNCMKDAVCSAYNEVPSVVKIVMIPVALAGNAYCKGRKSSTEQGCISNMLWGLWKSLIGNVEGLWSLAGMAWEGAKSLGRALCFWCEDEVQEVETATAVQLHALNNQSDGFFKKFTKNPVTAITGMFSNFFNGMKNYIAESVQSNFMCLNMTRDLSAMAGDVKKAFTGDDSGQAKCEAENRYVNWDCATCAQKFNMFCGIGGFLGGEVVASFFMGKALSGVGQLASKTAKVAKGTRVGQALGRGFTSLSKTQTAKLLAELGVKALDGIKLIAYTGQYSIFKSGGKLVARIGKMIVPISSKRAKILMGLMNGTKKLAGGLYKYTGAKSYMRLLEDSFVLGYQGKAGMKALRAARLSGKMQGKLDVMRIGAKGDDAKLAVLGKHQEAINSLGDYQNLLKKAQAAKGEEQVRLLAEATTKRKQYSTLMAEANKASKEFNTALKIARKQNIAERNALNLANKNRTVTTEAVANSRLTNQARVSKIRTEFSELSKPQVNAVMKAHNKVPCRVGTCTQSQLAEKIKIMKQANIPKATYREVLRKGLAGSPPPPTGSLSGIRSLNVDEISSGAMVSVGRSSGGRTNATVTRIVDDGVMVRWVENGQVYTKKVKPGSLGTPYEFGQKVSVPRSGGGFSNAEVTQVLEGDRALVRWVENGQEKFKRVDLSSLRDPLTSGQKVKIPRSNGAVSEGVISNIDGQKALVSFELENGKLATKTVDMSSLGRVESKVSLKPVIKPSNVTPVKTRVASQNDVLRLNSPTEVGSTISVPRTGGGRSNGRIIQQSGDRYLVEFVEDGVTKTKLIDKTTVASPFKDGMSIGVSRTGGGYSNGEIVRLVDDNVAQVRFVENGKEYTKKITLSRAREPYTINMDVMVPRSGGGYSPGRISYMDGQKARVDFVTQTGESAYKTVDLKALQRSDGGFQLNGPAMLRQAPAPPSGFSSLSDNISTMERKVGNIEVRNIPIDGSVSKRFKFDEASGPMTFEHRVKDFEHAKKAGKIFENVSPASLPPGEYTWVAHKNGSMTFGRVEDGLEFGVKHANIAQGRNVMMGGELKVLDNGKIVYNDLSGTFTMGIMRESGDVYAQEMLKFSRRLFDDAAGGSSNVQYVRRTVFNPGNPTAASKKSMCAFLKAGDAQNKARWQVLAATGVCK